MAQDLILPFSRVHLKQRCPPLRIVSRCSPKSRGSANSWNVLFNFHLCIRKAIISEPHSQHSTLVGYNALVLNILQKNSLLCTSRSLSSLCFLSMCQIKSSFSNFHKFFSKFLMSRSVCQSLASILSPQYHWHRGAWLRRINDTAEFLHCEYLRKILTICENAYEVGPDALHAPKVSDHY